MRQNGNTASSNPVLRAVGALPRAEIAALVAITRGGFRLQAGRIMHRVRKGGISRTMKMARRTRWLGKRVLKRTA